MARIATRAAALELLFDKVEELFQDSKPDLSADTRLLEDLELDSIDTLDLFYHVTEGMPAAVLDDLDAACRNVPAEQLTLGFIADRLAASTAESAAA